jgi:hypothetical protein
MTRIGPRASRPALPPLPKRVRDENEGGSKARREKPNPLFVVRSYDKLHRATRGSESRTWNDVEGGEDRPAELVDHGGPPEPVRPGRKGDHAGLEIPLDPKPVRGEAPTEEEKKESGQVDPD